MAVDIPISLIRQLNKSGPRYTSYPTVPYWQTVSDDLEYRNYLKTCITGKKPVSLYFHIPFCSRICAYCGCNSIKTGGKNNLVRYVDSLCRELDLILSITEHHPSVIQMHWGGGTPSILPPGLIQHLYGEIERRVKILENAEIAIEINPMSTSLNKIKLLRKLGFNRISLGIQDLDPAVQKAIYRNQTEEKTRQIFMECRKQGFKSINVDLIYGLPAQTPGSFNRTLDSILSLSPDRVAVYSFAYLPAVKKHQEKIDTSLLPDVETKIQLYLQTITRFTENGYEFIGMDHFAKPDDELAIALHGKRLHRNFMGYTCQPEPDVIALGITAISDLKTCYSQNVRDLDPYYDVLAQGNLPTRKLCVLSRDDRIRRYLITRLMCDFEISKTAVEEKFGITFDEYCKEDQQRLANLEDLQLVENNAHTIHVTELGRYFVRNICFCFDPYYVKTVQENNHVPFSKTV